VRAGPSDGALIEDNGVAGQHYDMTGTDVMHDNKDLIEQCATMLAAQPRTRMNVKRTTSGIEVVTAGLDQLDVFAAGHPAGRPYRVGRDGKHTLMLRVAKSKMIEIVGFAQGIVRQRRRI
jgi:hypothetical protein